MPYFSLTSLKFLLLPTRGFNWFLGFHHTRHFFRHISSFKNKNFKMQIKILSKKFLPVKRSKSAKTEETIFQVLVGLDLKSAHQVDQTVSTTSLLKRNHSGCH